MSIFYSLIARNNDTIIAEADASSGNYPQVTLKVLKNNKAGSGFRSFANQEYTYYLLNEPPFTYLCLAKTGFSKLKCLSYLKDIRDQFNTLPSIDRETTIAYGLNSKLEVAMKQKMRFYSEANESDTKIKSLVATLKDTDNLMRENLDSINERGEKIEILVNTTRQMKSEATSLHNRAHRLHQKKKCENLRKKIILCSIYWFIIYCVAMAFCGGPLLSTCIDEMKGDKSNAFLPDNNN